MASRLLLASAVVCSLIAWLCVTATGQGDGILRPLRPSCSTQDNYTDGSQYEKNLNQLLDALPAAAGNNGWFYKGSAGDGAHQVFGLITCFADRNATRCLDCLARAPAGITKVCPRSRNVNALYDACVLRYSDAPLLATAELNYAWSVHGPNTTSGAFRSAVWAPLMSLLQVQVATSLLRLANDSTSYSSTEKIYGLAQCTRDLGGRECSRCISNYTGRLENLFPMNIGGAIKGYSCYLIYWVGKLDITLPPAVV